MWTRIGALFGAAGFLLSALIYFDQNYNHPSLPVSEGVIRVIQAPPPTSLEMIPAQSAASLPNLIPRQTPEITGEGSSPQTMSSPERNHSVLARNANTAKFQYALRKAIASVPRTNKPLPRIAFQTGTLQRTVTRLGTMAEGHPDFQEMVLDAIRETRQAYDEVSDNMPIDSNARAAHQILRSELVNHMWLLAEIMERSSAPPLMMAKVHALMNIPGIS